jgi:hypothetical protein
MSGREVLVWLALNSSFTLYCAYRNYTRPAPLSAAERERYEDL